MSKRSSQLEGICLLRIILVYHNLHLIVIRCQFDFQRKRNHLASGTAVNMLMLRLMSTQKSLLYYYRGV